MPSECPRTGRVNRRDGRSDTVAPARRRLLQVTADNEMASPARGRVLRPGRDPHTRTAVAYHLRTRVDLEPIAVTDAEVLLADLEHPGPRLRTDHRIVSASLLAALLRLWNL